jgi:hypothetical protein
MIDEMIAAEGRHLAQRLQQEDCTYKEGMFPSPASVMMTGRGGAI